MDCGCDAPKYSGGLCFGTWAGLGCSTRGDLWDVNSRGNIVIKYPHEFNKNIVLELEKHKRLERYIVKPIIPLDELKRKFAEFRDTCCVSGDKLIIHGDIVADLWIIQIFEIRREWRRCDFCKVRPATREVLDRGSKLWLCDNCFRDNRQNDLRVVWYDDIRIVLKKWEKLSFCNKCNNPVVMPKDAEEPPLYYCSSCEI